MKILLAEDDASTRRFIREVLQRAGHSVVPAKDVADGESAYAAAQFDLVICGNDCPQNNAGRNWFRRLQADGQKVLLTSGRLVEDLGDLPFLSQPFVGSELLAKINEVMADSPAPPTS